MNTTVERITERIKERSATTRKAYLEQIARNYENAPNRNKLSCGNLAHGFAACNAHDKEQLAGEITPNIGINTAYNDMLSAHKPYEDYPKAIREYANEFKATAQVAGGVPAMCDGVTQGQPGMDLSLFSRDVIALSAAVGLSHDMFDGTVNLGICDKIVPGLLIGSLKFGQLPFVFMPGGPMPSGITNEKKAFIRQQFAEGKIGRDELLKGESDSYHSPGTCTFYGTANSNQMLMEMMGMQLPGSSFVNPGTEMRDALNREAIKQLVKNIHSKDLSYSIGTILDEKVIVNGIVGLLATGGSTNHTIHLIAIARAAGLNITWDDFSELSDVVPLITRIYPNGPADVNHFHASGGMAFVIHTLLEAGLLHEDVNTIRGKGLSNYTMEPKLKDGEIVYEEGPKATLNDKIIRPVSDPFQDQGGLKVLKGNLGTAVIKVSAVDPDYYVTEGEAIVFDEQDHLIEAYKRGELDKDFIAVFPFQGPKHKGMPELHKLTPTLTVLQKKGHKVALVTDGRMSGASGKIPSAIHLAPEACEGGLINKIQTGDRLRVDAVTGTVECLTEGVEERELRTYEYHDLTTGRELFRNMRQWVSSSEDGASFLY